MNRRRRLVLAAGAGLAGDAMQSWAQAPTTGLRRVGILASSTVDKAVIALKPFFEHMHELGWFEDKNVRYDWAYADDALERLPGLAVELVARSPELIYAATVPAALAAKQATATIPIVFATVVDPVELGLVTSLARPGGNVTGIGSLGSMLAPKRVQLLREMLPGLRRLGMVGSPNDASTQRDRLTLAPVISSMGLSLIVAEAANPGEFDAAMGKLIDARVEAVITGATSLAYFMHRRMIELASNARVPVVAYRPIVAEAGALFAYGASLADQIARSALHVDRILRGRRPGDLPVEQPTVFELVINLKTARALGITVPRSILLRADKVIE